MGRITFILADVFEGESEARVFALNDADFAESTLAHHAQEAEVVEVDWEEIINRYT